MMNAKTLFLSSLKEDFFSGMKVEETVNSGFKLLFTVRTLQTLHIFESFTLFH